MGNAIEWCNNNQGFISAVLSIMTILISIVAIVISIRTSKIPYKKKIAVTPYYYIKKGKHKLDVIITNFGNAPIIIEYFEVLDDENEDVKISGGIGLEPLIINAKSVETVSLEVSDEDGFFSKYADDLNKHMKIVITDVTGKKFTFKKGFPVG